MVEYQKNHKFIIHILINHYKFISQYYFSHALPSKQQSMKGKYMYMTDEELLLEFQHKRRVKTQTMKGYKNIVKIYTNFNNMTLTELFEEAIEEETDRVRWADRTLKTRLEEFRIHLYDNYTKKTAKIHFGRIKTLYRHFDIEIHKLPEIQTEDTEPPITYKDLPTKEILRKSLNISTPMMRALQLMMVSTGLAKKEIRHITIQDIIDSTTEYHNKNNIIDVVNQLKDRDDIVPTFHLKRFKTGKWFYTFCTPEAFQALLAYLIIIINNHHKLEPTDRIFDINKDYFNNYFKEINEALGLGKVRKYNRYTSHMLRRYHASTLESNGLDKDTVNRLQGKSQNPTDAAYFKTNPEKLKEKYVKYMHCLYVDFDIKEIKPEEIIELENENQMLKDENNMLKDRQEQLDDLLARIKKLEEKE